MTGPGSPFRKTALDRVSELDYLDEPVRFPRLTPLLWCMSLGLCAIATAVAVCSGMLIR